jgi:hypothetical protein
MTGQLQRIWLAVVGGERSGGSADVGAFSGAPGVLVRVAHYKDVAGWKHVAKALGDNTWVVVDNSELVAVVVGCETMTTSRGEALDTAAIPRNRVSRQQKREETGTQRARRR